MPSISVYIQKKPYKNGMHPFFLSFYPGNGQSPVRETLFSVESKYVDWKKKRVKLSHPIAYALNDEIEAGLTRVRLYLSECRRVGKSPDALIVFSKKSSETVLELATKAAQTQASFKPIAALLKDSPLNVPVFTVNDQWGEDFVQLMTSRGLKPSTRKVYAGLVRRLLPGTTVFDKIRLTNGAQKEVKLDIERFKSIMSLPISKTAQKYRDAWVFPVYARGMRRMDVIKLKWENIIDGKIIYKTSKGARQHGGKQMEIPISPEMQDILHRLPRQNQYVFAWLGQEKSNEKRAAIHLSMGIKRVLLKELKKSGFTQEINFHSARHTFAFIAKKKGIPDIHIQHMLGHSSPVTTAIYTAGLIERNELDDVSKNLFD